MKLRLAHTLLLLFYFTFWAKGQIITTIAGTIGVAGYSGNSGPAVSALLRNPVGIAADATGNIYFTDQNNYVVRKIDNGGNITTVAGNGVPGYSGDGGNAILASFRSPVAVAVDKAGNLFIADNACNVIRKVDVAGIITTFAGNGMPGYVGDLGPSIQAELSGPTGVAVDNNGNVYISDVGNRVVRKVNAAGFIGTFAGNGTIGYSGDGGPSNFSQLGTPAGIATDVANNVYIADSYYSVIRMINASGVISTFAGNGTAGYGGDGGLAVSAQLGIASPQGLASDGQGNVWVSDYENFAIRRIGPNGIIRTIAGNGSAGYSGDGGPAIAAQLRYAWGIAADNSGNLYMTDVFDHTIRKILLCPTIAASGVSINATVTAACEGTPVTFTATLTGAGSSPKVQWMVNGKTAGTNNPVFVTDSLGNGDVVSCMLTSGDVCIAPARSNDIPVTIFPNPVVTLPPDTAIFFGSSAVLDPLVTGSIVGYQWTPAGGLSDPTIASPIATPQDSVTYHLTVTSGDGCIGEGKITLLLLRKLQIPNAFTPNGDGKNDVFRIPPQVTLLLADFSVYDRWGSLVFKTSDIGKGWDGTFGNKPAEAGAYVYIIRGTFLGAPVLEKGTVMLVR